MSSGQGVEVCGYEFELYLDSIKYFRIIEPLAAADLEKPRATLIHDRFAVVGGVDLAIPERKDKARAAAFEDS